MTIAQQFGDPVATVRAALLVLGCLGIWLAMRLWERAVPWAAIGLLASMWLTTVIPAAAFDVCRPGWSLWPGRAPGTSGVPKRASGGDVRWGVPPPRVVPPLAPRAAERR